MPVVTILADAPWGPVRFGTAGSMGELLDRLTATTGQAPAKVVDVGDRNPAEVVKAALRQMPPPVDAMGPYRSRSTEPLGSSLRPFRPYTLGQ